MKNCDKKHKEKMKKDLLNKKRNRSISNEIDYDSDQTSQDADNIISKIKMTEKINYNNPDTIFSTRTYDRENLSATKEIEYFDPKKLIFKEDKVSFNHLSMEDIINKFSEKVKIDSRRRNNFNFTERNNFKNNFNNNNRSFQNMKRDNDYNDFSNKNNKSFSDNSKHYKNTQNNNISSDQNYKNTQNNNNFSHQIGINNNNFCDDNFSQNNNFNNRINSEYIQSSKYCKNENNNYSNIQLKNEELSNFDDYKLDNTFDQNNISSLGLSEQIIINNSLDSIENILNRELKLDDDSQEEENNELNNTEGSKFMEINKFIEEKDKELNINYIGENNVIDNKKNLNFLDIQSEKKSIIINDNDKIKQTINSIQSDNSYNNKTEVLNLAYIQESINISSKPIIFLTKEEIKDENKIINEKLVDLSQQNEKQLDNKKIIEKSDEIKRTEETIVEFERMEEKPEDINQIFENPIKIEQLDVKPLDIELKEVKIQIDLKIPSEINDMKLKSVNKISLGNFSESLKKFNKKFSNEENIKSFDEFNNKNNLSTSDEINQTIKDKKEINFNNILQRDFLEDKKIKENININEDIKNDLYSKNISPVDKILNNRLSSKNNNFSESIIKNDNSITETQTKKTTVNEKQNKKSLDLSILSEKRKEYLNNQQNKSVIFDKSMSFDNSKIRIDEISKKDKISFTKNLNCSNLNNYSKTNKKSISYIGKEPRIQIIENTKENTEKNIINSPNKSNISMTKEILTDVFADLYELLCYSLSSRKKFHKLDELELEKLKNLYKIMIGKCENMPLDVAFNKGQQKKMNIVLDIDNTILYAKQINFNNPSDNPKLNSKQNVNSHFIEMNIKDKT